MYEMSAKKSRELEEIVRDLKECLQFQDGGVKPIQVIGSRWISRKLAALKCAMFVDLLTPCSIFSNILRSDKVDILAALNGVLLLYKLRSEPLDQWSKYAATISKIASDGNLTLSVATLF